MSEEKPLKVSYSKQFVRDLTDLAKRSPNVLIGSKYITAIHCLLNRLSLPENYQDHALVGEWKGYRDCHIKMCGLFLHSIKTQTEQTFCNFCLVHKSGLSLYLLLFLLG